METFRFSWKYFIIGLGLLGLEIIIALFVHDDFVRPYVGDVLIMFLMYSFIKAFTGRPTRRLPYYLFTFAVFIELLQLFQLTHLLGLQENILVTTILGSVFDFRDIISYFIGMLFLIGYEQALRKDISYL
jgi:hypothetical protein